MHPSLFKKLNWLVLGFLFLSLPAGALTDQEQADANAFLLLAVSMDNAERVQLRLSEGADPNAKDKLGQTALMMAVNQASPAVAEALLKAGADPNQKAVGGTVALHWAVYFNKQGFVDLLLKNGAKLDLFSAAALNDLKALKALLKTKPPVNEKGPLGATPLFFAKSGEAATLLLKAGGDPNFKGAMENTPLHTAAMEGRAAVVKALLKGGADKTLTNSKGQTARDLAQEKGHTAVLALF